MTTTKPMIATPKPTESTTTKAAPTSKESTTEIYTTTKNITRRTNSFSETTSNEIETTSLTETEPIQNSSEITMTTRTDRRSPGNDKILDTSRDHSSSKSMTVVVVSVLCSLVVLAALSFMTVYLLRKRTRPWVCVLAMHSYRTVYRGIAHEVLLYSH